MTFSPKFKSKVFSNIAHDCGLVVEFNGSTTTSSEIEFFAEQIVKKCLELGSSKEIEKYFQFSTN